MKKTRAFSFPNRGHSVRKLSEALEELGSARVSLKWSYASCDDLDFDVWFEEDHDGDYIAQKLAKKIKNLGTRFVADIDDSGNVALGFYTSWDDFKAYPKFYDIA